MTELLIKMVNDYNYGSCMKSYYKKINNDLYNRELIHATARCNAIREYAEWICENSGSFTLHYRTVHSDVMDCNYQEMYLKEVRT